MEYQAMNNAVNQGAALGGLNSALSKQEAPRTLASAAGRLETINERLAKANDALSMVCAQIGAMSSVGNQIGGQSANAPVPSGAVHRLNDLADDANVKLSHIESYIASLQRALG